MDKIAFAGTFDPVTTGHLWVVGEAINLADEVVVFIADNQSKNPLFSAQERLDIFNEALVEYGWSEKVKVTTLKGAYVARAAKNMGCEYLIRGIRSTVDFDYENLLQQTNTDVLHGAKTVFVMSPQNLGAVSSSYVKSLIGPPGWHWYVSNFLPRSAYAKLRQKRLKWYWEKFVSNSTNQWAAFDQLEASYSTARPYHNLDHVMHVLDELLAHPEFENLSNVERSYLIRSAFVHDVIQGKSNELELSIELFNANVCTNDKLTDLEKALVMSTGHKDQITFEGKKECLLRNMLVSADLSILGQDAYKYDTYACSVKEEYLNMHPILSKTPLVYKEGRKKVMKSFLDRAQRNALFTDEYFEKLYNSAAIENISRELAELDS